jgi:hypothetical protein
MAWLRKVAASSYGMMEAPRPCFAIESAAMVSEALAWLRREAAAGLAAASCF